MKQEIILKGIQLRSLFDSFSHEFKSSTVEDKILTLSILNYYGLLKQVINDYQIDYKEKERDDIVKTLRFFIQILNNEKYLEIIINDKVKPKGIIEILECELKAFSDKNYSKEKFIKSFLEYDEQEYIRQKNFFKIDLNEDITSTLLQRDISENKEFQEKYIHLYKTLVYRLITDYRKHKYEGYVIDNGIDYQSEYVLRFFLQEPNKDNYFEAIKYAIDVLYFEKVPYNKYVLFRNNFGNPEQVKKFYNNNETAIHLDTERDFEDWEKFLKGQNPKQQYLQRWKSLNELVSKEDVIILASYQGIGFKIGKVKKGTNFEKVVNGKSTYYFFKLEYAKQIDISSSPFVQSILPANVTLSNIYRKNYSLRKLFPGVGCNITSFEKDDISIEILVAEWLRSKYAPEGYKIKYQILKTGGNFKDSDIIGITENNEKLVVQVSNTSNLGLIKKKIAKLENYKNCMKLFFFNTSDQIINGQKVIDVKKVIYDFRNDDYYQRLISELQ